MLVLGLTCMKSVQSPEGMPVVEVPEFATDSWHGKQGVTGEAYLLRGVDRCTHPASGLGDVLLLDHVGRSDRVQANAYRNRGCGRPCDRGCGAPVFFNTVAGGSSAVAADELMDRVLAFNQPDQTPMWGVDD